MRRVVPLIALCLLFGMAATVTAQEDSIRWSGTVGSEASLYPSLGDTTWLGLSLSVFDFTMASTTSFNFPPFISGSQLFKLAYT